MPYRLHLVNGAGIFTALGTPFGTIERAMTIACTAMRHGAKDAGLWTMTAGRSRILLQSNSTALEDRPSSFPKGCSSIAAAALLTAAMLSVEFSAWAGFCPKRVFPQGTPVRTLAGVFIYRSVTLKNRKLCRVSRCTIPTQHSKY
jgi:hypothetical protein